MAACDPPLDRRAAWLRLSLSPGVGPLTARALIERFGTPEAVLQSPFALLAELAGPARALALTRPDADLERQIEATLDWGCLEGHHLIGLTDPAYPALLAEIADAPTLLYAVGDATLLRRPTLAIVGSRNPTAAGVVHAEAFARALSEAGWTVASGLALGIDGAAHRGALAGGSGTVAVLGTGVDVLYPSRHRVLAAAISRAGLLVSELPLGTQPSPGQFPRRNRLIAGLARGVLVIEAALHSGSLITARQAGEFGREVLALPGSIDSPLARGCHALIRDGAVLVESAEDVIAALPAPGSGGSACAGAGGTVAAPGPATHPPPIDPLLALIGHSPVLPDALGTQLNLPAGELRAKLVLLELAGQLDRLADGRVVRRTGQT